MRKRASYRTMRTAFKRLFLLLPSYEAGYKSAAELHKIVSAYKTISQKKKKPHVKICIVNFWWSFKLRIYHTANSRLQ